MPTFTNKQFKTILNRKKFIDSWFWNRYSVNPYNGCAFGCVYCDARNSKYRMPADFENEIIVKLDAGDMLDRRISRARRLLVDVVGIGGVTDCYQGIEKSQKNTQQILRVLCKHRFPVHVSTKSTLVTRDAALLNEIGQRSWCSVSITLTTLDDKLARFLDNRSPLPEQRLETIRTLKSRCPDVHVGVNLIPVVPYLSDDRNSLAELTARVSEAGADYLLFGGGLSLRDRAASWFLESLASNYPSTVDDYRRLYQFESTAPYDGKPSPPLEYLIPLHAFLGEQCARTGIRTRIRRFIPDDFRKSNYLVAERLLNSAYRRQLKGAPYSDQFWAGQNIQNLNISIESVSAKDELDSVRNVRGKVLRRVSKLLTKIC